LEFKPKCNNCAQENLWKEKAKGKANKNKKMSNDIAGYNKGLRRGMKYETTRKVKETNKERSKAKQKNE
jgi:hypothetical protein